MKEIRELKVELGIYEVSFPQVFLCFNSREFFFFIFLIYEDGFSLILK